MDLSVVIITHNEESNIGRTLASVQSLVRDGKGEIIAVDSGSTDRTVEIARSSGAKVFIEPWKGYAAQKNSAIEKATGDWVLSIDADEEVDVELALSIKGVLDGAVAGPNEWCLTMTQKGPGLSNTKVPKRAPIGFWIARKNFFLGRWMKHGGFWPDRKLRLFRRGAARFEDRLVHEDAQITGATAMLPSALLHHSYPTLSDYIGHMDRYSSLGAEMAMAQGRRDFSGVDIVLRPALTFIYNYIFRLGCLDGREGLLLHLYHAVYVSWKYAKIWELCKGPKKGT